MKIKKSRINRNYKLYPTKCQEKKINQHLFHLTSVYNWALSKLEHLNIDLFDLTKSNSLIPFTRDISTLTNNIARDYLNNQTSGHSKRFKERTEQEINIKKKNILSISQTAIHGTINKAVEARSRHLNQKYDKSIPKKQKAGKPRRKGLRNKLNYIYYLNDIKLSKDRRHIIIPNIGHVRFKGDIPENGKLKTALIKKKASGYYITLCFDDVPKQIIPVANKLIGIDPGFDKALNIASFDSEIEHLELITIENPRFYEKEQEKLANAQRGGAKIEQKLSKRKLKKKKRSLKRQARSRKTALLHEKLANRRKDAWHKLSRHLVAENKQIFWSNDNFKAMAGLFGKSVNSLGLGMLREMIETKSKNSRADGSGLFSRVNNKKSTITCGSCWSFTGPRGLLGLKERDWICESCGARHGRDFNSAVITLILGLGESSEDMATCVWNQYLNYLGIDNSIFRETLFEQIAAGSSDLFKSQ